MTGCSRTSRCASPSSTEQMRGARAIIARGGRARVGVESVCAHMVAGMPRPTRVCSRREDPRTLLRPDRVAARRGVVRLSNGGLPSLRAAILRLVNVAHPERAARAGRAACCPARVLSDTAGGRATCAHDPGLGRRGAHSDGMPPAPSAQWQRGPTCWRLDRDAAGARSLPRSLRCGRCADSRDDGAAAGARSRRCAAARERLLQGLRMAHLDRLHSDATASWRRSAGWATRLTTVRWFLLQMRVVLTLLSQPRNGARDLLAAVAAGYMDAPVVGPAEAFDDCERCVLVRLTRSGISSVLKRSPKLSVNTVSPNVPARLIQVHRVYSCVGPKWR